MLSPKLPFTSKSAAVRIFRHALSLDERRTKFAPTFYANLVPGEVDATAFVQRSDSKEVWFVGHHSGMSFTNIRHGQMRRTLNFGYRCWGRSRERHESEFPCSYNIEVDGVGNNKK